MAKSMFERYGGFAFLSKVVMTFYDRVLDSDTLGPYFDGVPMRRLMDHQTKFVASIMGGPASFTDDHLRTVHAHLAIDQAGFDEMLEVMRATLAEFKMAPDDIEAILDAMRARTAQVVADQT